MVQGFLYPPVLVLLLIWILNFLIFKFNSHGWVQFVCTTRRKVCCSDTQADIVFQDIKKLGRISILMAHTGYFCPMPLNSNFDVYFVSNTSLSDKIRAWSWSRQMFSNVLGTWLFRPSQKRSFIRCTLPRSPWNRGSRRGVFLFSRQLIAVCASSRERLSIVLFFAQMSSCFGMCSSGHLKKIFPLLHTQFDIFQCR